MSKPKKEQTGVCPSPKSDLNKVSVMGRVSGMARNRGGKFTIEGLLWCLRTWPDRASYKQEACDLTDWLIDRGLRKSTFDVIEAMRCVELLASAGYFGGKEA